MEIRDYKADMKAAYLDEYAASVRAGRTERAAIVAKTLSEEYDYEVEPKADVSDEADKPRRGRPPKLRLDEPKLPEVAVEPKPQHDK